MNSNGLAPVDPVAFGVSRTAPEYETDVLTPVDQSLVSTLARAEIDQQISTARAFPRSIDRAVKNIMSLATLDEQTAQECIYALPRAGKAIMGPSARFAEIIASQWGNSRISARVVHVDRTEKYVEAEGIFHDLETNTAVSTKVRRRLTDKYGKLLTEDMIIVTGNAACAIARRNAILNSVPKGVWRKAYDRAVNVSKGDIATLQQVRDQTISEFVALGIKPEQVFAAVGIGGPGDVKIDHIPLMRGMLATLQSGEATVEEMFGGGKGRGPVAGEAPVVSDEQAKILTDLITETKTDIQTFLKAAGAPGVSDIPASQFAHLKELLEKKKAKASQTAKA